jgi:hypothetical protein
MTDTVRRPVIDQRQQASDSLKVLAECVGA